MQNIIIQNAEEHTVRFVSTMIADMSIEGMPETQGQTDIATETIKIWLGPHEWMSVSMDEAIGPMDEAISAMESAEEIPQESECYKHVENRTLVLEKMAQWIELLTGDELPQEIPLCPGYSLRLRSGNKPEDGLVLAIHNTDRGYEERSVHQVDRHKLQEYLTMVQTMAGKSSP